MSKNTVMDFLFNTYPDADPIHIPGSFSELDGNSDLIIHSDDGNESSYGFDKWDFRVVDKGYVILAESYGRDCFEDNLSDAICGQFIGDSGVVDIEVFKAELIKHIAKWTERTNEYMEQNNV